jgi:hypothetical protein
VVACTAFLVVFAAIVHPFEGWKNERRSKVVLCMKRYYVTFLLLLASVLGGIQSAQANFISYTETVYNTDFLSAGLGGLRNVGTGAIMITNLTGTVKKAYLFWHGPMVASATNPAANATIKLNGETITGVNLGFSSDNCWSTIDTDANYVYSAAYRADVTSLVANKGNGSYTLSDTIKAYGYRRSGATNLMGININGASLLVFYDDGNPNNNRDIVLYEGNDSNAQSPFAPNTLGYDDAGWNVKLSGINYTSGPVTLQLHISDGQFFEPGDDGAVYLNKSIVEPAGHVFSGTTTPRLNDGPYHLGSLWDIKNYGITSFLTPGVNSITISNTAIGFDCISLIVAAVNLPSGAAPHTNAPPTLGCQAPVTIAAGQAIIRSDVFYSAAGPLNYTIAVDGNISSSGTLPASSAPRSATLSLTNVFGYGQHIVTFTVVDNFGSATCSTLVTVLPNINCPTNIVQSTDPGKSTAVVNYTITSDAPGTTVACLPASGSVFPLGNTTVNCTATDTNGNNAVCSFLVTIRDTEPPNIDCPPSRIVSTDRGTNNAVVTYAVAANDNLPGVTTTCLPASGSVFPLGITTVNCVARDIAGNTAACSFTVTVNDTEPPQIQCPTNIVKSLELGKTNAVVTWTIEASDNVAGVNVTCLPPSGSVFPKGSTAVNCTARDLAGNAASCGFTVIITDGEPPIISCPGKDIVQQTDPGTNNALVTFNVTATDNMPGVTVLCTPASGTFFPVGTNNVTCTATDISGNTASCSFKVVIVDQEPPQITCPANVPRIADAGACTASNVVYFANAADNVPGVSVRCEPPSGSSFSVGSTPVICTAMDAAGNHSSCSFLVTVDDREAPKLTLPGDLPRTTDPGSCSAVVNFDPGASDNCPGQLLVVCVPPSGSTFQKGTNVVTCRAMDASGNSVTNTFKVIVSDTELPRITCPADILQAADIGRTDAIVNFSVTATDNCGPATVVSSPPSGSRFSLGTNLVTSVATDSSGNTASCTFLVIIVDQEPPHITCPAPIIRAADTNTCSATNVTFSLSVTDNVPGVSYSCIPPSGSIFATGTNIVTCTATDAAGNRASCSFPVIIQDKQAPVLSLPPNITQQGDVGSCSAVVNYSASAADNCSGQALLVCTPPSGSTFQKGTTAVICRATDASGNSVTNSFSVTVNDTERPTIVCPADIHVPSETGKSSAIVNFTVNATDNCGTPTVVSTPASGSRFPMGTNLVTSTATDSSGNKSTCTFLVVVGDAQPPTITCPPANITTTNTPGLCSATVSFTVNVSDNKPGTTLVCQPPSGSAFPSGTNLVTCTATDVSGNTAQCVFLVIVRDTEKPVLRLNGPASVTNECHSPFIDPGATATDNCGGNLTSAIKVTGAVDANTPGIYQVTYSVSDASGNSASITRAVTVVDTKAPVLTLLGANPFSVPCGRTYEEPGFTASDACAGDLTPAVVVSGSVDASAPGTYTLTYTVTDPSGNTVAATRKVEVSTGIIEGGQLFPIAVGKDSLSGAAVGDVVANIFNGVRPGNFGWITWSGSSSAGALATSLLPPGNSDTYQNPYNPSDHVLSVGDWVMGNTGVSDSGDVRTALDILKQFDITIPVYDLSTSSGSGALYHIVAFARVRLTAYDLTQKTISARFLGYVTCSCEGNDLMNMSLQSSFNIGNISAGNYLWFNGVLHIGGMKTNAVKIRLVNQTITSSSFNLSVSNASVIFDPKATNATVDFVNGEWLTRVPMTASNENVFLSGLAYQLPAGTSGKTKAYWNGTFLSDTPDVTLSWKWAVAPYAALSADAKLLGVKPVDNAQMSVYKNADLAGTPENYKGSYISGKTSGFTGAYSGVASVSACHNLNGQSMAVPKGVTVLPLIGGKHSVMWTAKPGKSYKVQYKDSLLAPAWTELSGTVVATDATASMIDNSVAPLTQRFYRIVMLP